MALGWLGWYVGGDRTARDAVAACPDPRRVRLAGCAAARVILQYMADDSQHEHIALAERLADDPTAWLDRHVARELVAGWRALQWPYSAKGNCVLPLLDEPFDPRAVGRTVTLAQQTANSHLSRPTWRAITAAVLDVLGDPYDPAPFDPAWRTPDAVGVAAAVYDARAFGDLPVLADALQEAGCADERVLGHCRGGGAHYRGCWVVDGVLE